MSYYEYLHTVGFAETNVVGNVYFTHYLSWQGRCRELFLAERAPAVLAQMSGSDASGEAGAPGGPGEPGGGRLVLATVRCSCDYLAELQAFDEVAVRMRLAGVAQSRLTLAFEYWRRAAGGEELVARGEQQVAFLFRRGAVQAPAPVPAALREALRPFASPEMLL